MINVIFVCYANICRSPMAHGLFQAMLAEEGLADQVAVDSAGVGQTVMGRPTHQGTIDVLQRHGISFSKISRALTARDFASTDYILAVDKLTLRGTRNLQPFDSEAGIFMLLDFAEKTRRREVPDPYSTGRFDEAYELIEAGLRGFLISLRTRHNL